MLNTEKKIEDIDFIRRASGKGFLIIEASRNENGLMEMITLNYNGNYNGYTEIPKESGIYKEDFEEYDIDCINGLSGQLEISGINFVGFDTNRGISDFMGVEEFFGIVDDNKHFNEIQKQEFKERYIRATAGFDMNGAVPIEVIEENVKKMSAQVDRQIKIANNEPRIILNIEKEPIMELYTTDNGEVLSVAKDYIYGTPTSKVGDDRFLYLDDASGRYDLEVSGEHIKALFDSGLIFIEDEEAIAEAEVIHLAEEVNKKRDFLSKYKPVMNEMKEFVKGATINTFAYDILVMDSNSEFIEELVKDVEEKGYHNDIPKVISKYGEILDRGWVKPHLEESKRELLEDIRKYLSKINNELSPEDILKKIGPRKPKPN